MGCRLPDTILDSDATSFIRAASLTHTTGRQLTASKRLGSRSLGKPLVGSLVTGSLGGPYTRQ